MRRADHPQQRGNGRIVGFDRVGAIEQPPHRLVVDAGFDKAFAIGQEAVSGIEAARRHLRVQ